MFYGQRFAILSMFSMISRTPWEAATATAAATTTTTAVGGEVFFFCKEQKKMLQPFFDASGYKNISATIRIGREIRCLPYADFLN